MANNALSRWHDFVTQGEPAILNEILADTAVFHSPVVHAPQHGKALVTAYLSAAYSVFSKGSFEYLGEWHSDDGAVLEFKAEIDGIVINGVDMMRFDANGQIVDFKVMVRPLKGVNLLHQMMKAMLEAGG